MKHRILHSPASKKDLAEAWRFIAADSVYYADRFLRHLNGRLAHLAANPLIGRPRGELTPELRSFPVNPLVVFYFPAMDGISIVRILHSARDIRREMFPE